MPAPFNFDPCADERWPRFLEHCTGASVFHTPGWLEALRRTYGYEPIAYTTSSPGTDLGDGLVFCRISTWLSTKRLVSLPFSDHVALLGDNAKALEQILSFLSEQVKARFCNYLEVRPTARLSSDTLRNGSNFCWHKLPLNREISDLYKSFHPSCIQRKIRRAERERLVYSEGTSEELIQQFYRLLVLTHRRHGVPPQPISWFRNLRDCLGNGIKFRVASKNGRAVASIVTLTHKKVMVYKYGCSDAKHHNLGGMIFLFWQAIQDAKSSGLDELDMGRSDWDNPGLITFKENWNAERHTLVYSVYPDASRPNLTGWRARAARGLFTIVPTVALPPLGRMLYRHFG